MKIEGIPDGWELVRIGPMKKGEWSLSADGIPFEAHIDTTRLNFPIIRRIDPALSIPPRVFADGWIVGQSSGSAWLLSEKPQYVLTDAEGWRIDKAVFLPVGRMPCLKFDDSLPESERICRVTWEHGSECEQA